MPAPHTFLDPKKLPQPVPAESGEGSRQPENWTPEQLQYILWKATPKAFRDPKTQGEYAKRYKVSQNTLINWQRVENFRQAVNYVARKLLEDEVPEFFGALSDQAKAGEFPHLKLALELAGEHTDKVDLSANIRIVGLDRALDKIYGVDEDDDEEDEGSE